VAPSKQRSSIAPLSSAARACVTASAYRAASINRQRNAQLYRRWRIIAATTSWPSPQHQHGAHHRWRKRNGEKHGSKQQWRIVASTWRGALKPSENRGHKHRGACYRSGVATTYPYLFIHACRRCAARRSPPCVTCSAAAHHHRAALKTAQLARQLCGAAAYGAARARVRASKRGALMAAPGVSTSAAIKYLLSSCKTGVAAAESLNQAIKLNTCGAKTAKLKRSSCACWRRISARRISRMRKMAWRSLTLATLAWQSVKQQSPHACRKRWRNKHQCGSKRNHKRRQYLKAQTAVQSVA